jgi:hypothetical protein
MYSAQNETAFSLLWDIRTCPWYDADVLKRLNELSGQKKNVSLIEQIKSNEVRITLRTTSYENNLLISLNTVVHSYFQDLKYWCTMLSPAVLYLIIGLILKTTLVAISKILTIFLLCGLLLACRRYILTANYTLDFPLAVYLATKVTALLKKIW